MLFLITRQYHYSKRAGKACRACIVAAALVMAKFPNPPKFTAPSAGIGLIEA